MNREVRVWKGGSGRLYVDIVVDSKVVAYLTCSSSGRVEATTDDPATTPVTQSEVVWSDETH